ncbi:MAG TPA: helix-turn-helix transcriptional regulator [Burkholderiales bacterium]|nr:helix-turn-helix transcriptional regulator [Burkholderiales bacterium]
MSTAEERIRIGRRLKRRRQDQGLGQKAIAKKAGVAIGTVQAIECGKRKVLMDNIEKYAVAVGTTLQDILLPETVAPATMSILVSRQTAASVVTVLGRTIDAVAAEIAHDLLRNPKFHAELEQLVRAAFQQALKPAQDEP